MNDMQQTLLLHFQLSQAQNQIEEQLTGGRAFEEGGLRRRVIRKNKYLTTLKSFFSCF
jgi:hypothetical protein